MNGEYNVHGHDYYETTGIYMGKVASASNAGSPTRRVLLKLK